MKIHIYSFSNLDTVYSLSYPLLKKYCKNNNYTYNFYYDNLEQAYEPHWNKILYAIKILEMKLDADYIVWFDHDIIIKNFDIKLHDIIKEYSFDKTNHKFMMSDTPCSDEKFNSGVCVFKNNKETLNVFKKMIHMRNNPYEYPMLEKYHGYDFHEENSIQDTRTFLVHFHENPEDLLSIPYKILQSFYPAKQQYNHGDFCGHVAGPQGRVLTIFMKQLINMPTIDNNKRG